jgi:hypothetical protein
MEKIERKGERDNYKRNRGERERIRKRERIERKRGRDG